MTKCTVSTYGPAIPAFGGAGCSMHRWMLGLVFCIGCGPGVGSSDAIGSGSTTRDESESAGTSDVSTSVTATSAGTTAAAEPSCDPVVIPDPELEAAVRAALEIPEGPISGEAMASLTALEVNWVGSVAGLECAVNLQSLDIGDGLDVVVDLTPISGLQNLRIFQYSGGNDPPPLDLTPIAGLDGLETIVLQSVILEDIGPVGGLSNVTSLGVHGCEVADIAPIANLTQLEELSIGGTHIVDATPLSSLTNLHALDLIDTGTSDLTPLSSLIKLRRLKVRNGVENLEPLAGMVQLEELDVEWNMIQDFSPVAGLPELARFYASGNQISDITPLTLFPKLVTVDLTENQITDVSPLLGHTWELPLGCGDLSLLFNPLNEESKLTYMPQICDDTGIYSDHCGEYCLNSCIVEHCCSPMVPDWPECAGG